jgi:hypothetical protein
MEDDKLMLRHKSRKLVDFVPYWCRPSENGFLRTLNEAGDATIRMEVLGLGELIIRADGIGPGNEAFCSVVEKFTTT